MAKIQHTNLTNLVVNFFYMENCTYSAAQAAEIIANLQDIPEEASGKDSNNENVDSQMDTYQLPPKIHPQAGDVNPFPDRQQCK